MIPSILSPAKRRELERLGFDFEAYHQRLLVLRSLYGEDQKTFARRLGIDAKRWNNFERGYPMSRQMGFLMMHKLPGFSIDWLWLGMEGNLSVDMRTRIRAAERALGNRDH